MKTWFGSIVVWALVLAGARGAVWADTAQQAFASGKALLAKADLQGALQAFAAAAREDQDNQEYRQHHAIVRRVIELRRQLDAERDPARWEYVARGLHAFYISEGLLTEALAVNKKMHGRLNTAESAQTLADTQLALNMNREASETLGGLDPSKQTPATRALSGIALARQGNMDQAQQIAAGIDLEGGAGPSEIYSVARLNAVVGNEEQALALLARCFEGLAPSRLPAFKAHAQKTPEFTALVSTPAYDQVLRTESKIPESKCSGGSRCASCPMRGQCRGNQGK